MSPYDLQCCCLGCHCSGAISARRSSGRASLLDLASPWSVLLYSDASAVRLPLLLSDCGRTFEKDGASQFSLTYQGGELLSRYAMDSALFTGFVGVLVPLACDAVRAYALPSHLRWKQLRYGVLNFSSVVLLTLVLTELGADWIAKPRQVPVLLRRIAPPAFHLCATHSLRTVALSSLQCVSTNTKIGMWPTTLLAAYSECEHSRLLQHRRAGRFVSQLPCGANSGTRSCNRRL